ncbi:hypothetical protein JCM10207_003682 [Rhodosporidiobolus poonsookiae]
MDLPEEDWFLDQGLWRHAQFVTYWTSGQLLAGETHEVTRRIFRFKIHAYDGKTRSSSWTARFKVGIQLVDDAAAEALGKGELALVQLYRRHGIQVRVDVGRIQSVVPLAWGATLSAWHFRKKDDPILWVDQDGESPLQFCESVKKSDFYVQTNVWISPHCTTRTYLDALLPYFYTADSLLPAPFKRVQHAKVVQSITASGFDVVFLFPTLDADGLPQRIYGHRDKYLAACPSLAALFGAAADDEDSEFSVESEGTLAYLEEEGEPSQAGLAQEASEVDADGLDGLDFDGDNAGRSVGHEQEDRAERSPAPSRSGSPPPKKPRLSQQASPPASESGRQSRTASFSLSPSPALPLVHPTLLEVPMDVLSYEQFLALHQYVYSVDRKVPEWDINEFTLTYLSDTPIGKALVEKMQAQLKEDPSKSPPLFSICSH